MDIVVLKCGGSVLEELKDDFFGSLRELIENGHYPVIVHGGGPAINRMLDFFEVEASFRDGLRVTCEKTMEIVELVLAGEVNRKLCALLAKHGFRPIGLNGSDGACLEGDFIDQSALGYVGEISSVNAGLIKMLLENGYIPVITPIATAKDGSKLNVNGDYAAASIAKALNADRCAFVTNVDGIMVNGKIKAEMTDQEIEASIGDGNIYGGMIPKVKSALAAMHAGIQKVMIISGKKQFYKNNSWQGTAIAAKERVLK